MAQDIRQGIISTANALGISPLDLATAISYETAGTFDPTKRGPTTKWGQHRGLIQFGEPQAQKYGVSWDDPIGSQLGPNGAVANYLRDTGVKPGMGLLDVYSAINAGGVGRYDRSDAAAGGAPGTVADKVNNQMAAHRQKAEHLLGSMAVASPAAAPVVQARPGSYVAPNTASADIPPAVQAAAGEPTKRGIADIFSLLALQGQQDQAPAPAPIMGPSPEQATALSSFLQSLMQRRA